MKLYIGILSLGVFLMPGCSGTANNSALPPSNANTTSKANATPATERSDGDDEFVESESGTAKATPESGKANVQGKVLFNGEPVPGVEVKLCGDFNNFSGKCGGETFKTKTDDAGEYLIANVSPGVYGGLLVRVFNTDSYVFATKGIGIMSAKYKFDADSTYFAPVTNLFKADLKLLEPKANASLAGTGVKIKWDAYPNAAYYRLSVNPEVYDSDSSIGAERVEGAEYTVNKILKPGKYYVTLVAFNSADTKLSELKERVPFTIK